MRRIQQVRKIRSFIGALAGLVGAMLALTPAPAAAQSQSHVPLSLWWDGTAGDNFTTTYAVADYQRVRVEGHILGHPHPGAVPLRLWYHAGRKDYFITATPESEQAAKNAGYQFRRVEGWVFADPIPGTVPLKLYWNASRGDNATVATARGEADQKASGYQFVRIEGYIFADTDTNFGATDLMIPVYQDPLNPYFEQARKTSFVVHPDSAENGCRYSWIGTTGAHPHDVVLTVCNNVVVGAFMKNNKYFPIHPDYIRASTVFEGRTPPTAASRTHGPTLDIAIAYSPRVKGNVDTMLASIGSAVPGQTYLNAWMQLSIDQGNAIFGASGIPATLRLVRTKRFTNIDETAFNSMEHALDRMADLPTAPCGDGDDNYGIYAFRNYAGADLVSIWIDGTLVPDARGWGYYGQSSYYCDGILAHSVIDAGSAVGPSHTFVHELGHNLGADHAPNEPNETDPFVGTYYHYGYVDVANRFTDIMAYGTSCKKAGVTCPELPYFSTPDVKVNPISKFWSQFGVPLGEYNVSCTTWYDYMGPHESCVNVSSADTARRIRERAGTVAGYRSPKW